MTPRLKAIKERSERATPGPWVYDCGNHQIETSKDRLEIAEECGSSQRKHDLEYRGYEPQEVDALLKFDPFDDMEFIALAREDIPHLLDLLERAKGVLEFTNMMVGHAIHLNYLGEGSTLGMAKDAEQRMEAVLKELSDE